MQWTGAVLFGSMDGLMLGLMLCMGLSLYQFVSVCFISGISSTLWLNHYVSS